MITLTIEDEKLQSIFLDEFHGNKENFFDFIKMSFDSFKKQDIDEDLSYLEDEIEKGFDSGRSGKTHNEIFRELRKKYDIN